jgi:hypothetical protein
MAKAKTKEEKETLVATAPARAAKLQAALVAELTDRFRTLGWLKGKVKKSEYGSQIEFPLGPATLSIYVKAEIEGYDRHTTWSRQRQPTGRLRCAFDVQEDDSYYGKPQNRIVPDDPAPTVEKIVAHVTERLREFADQSAKRDAVAEREQYQKAAVAYCRAKGLTLAELKDGAG